MSAAIWYLAPDVIQDPQGEAQLAELARSKTSRELLQAIQETRQHPKWQRSYVTRRRDAVLCAELLRRQRFGGEK